MTITEAANPCWRATISTFRQPRLRSKAVFSLFFICGLFVAKVSAQNPNAVYAEALQKFRSEDYFNSLQLFRQLRELTGRQDFSYYIGFCELHTGAYQEAETAFLDALRAQPGSWEIRLGLARARYQLNRRDEARADFLSVLAQVPGNIESLYHLGLIDLGAGDTNSARTHFLAVLEVDPNHLGATYNLGQALLRSGDRDGAEEWLLKHQELSAEFDELESLRLAASFETATAYNWLSLGDAYLKLGYAERALQAYRTAKKLDPDLAQTDYYIGYVLWTMGRDQEAIDSYRNFLTRQPGHFEGLFNLAQAERRLGLRDEALSTLSRASDTNPGSPLPHISRIEILIEAQEWIAASDAARGLTQRHPNLAHAFFLYGFCLKELGELEPALAAAKRALELEPSSQTFELLVDQLYALQRGRP